MKHTEKDGKDKDTAKKAQESELKQEAAAPATEEMKKEPKQEKAEAPKDDDKTKIASLEKAVLELEDKRIRLIAEMDNMRKRAGKEMETLRYHVMTDTLHPFFQVFDHFSMAVAATQTTDNLKALLDGMKMIQMEFDRAFSDLGIEKIDAVGKDFDPNTQEAVSQEASETVPAGKVIRQWSFGYKCGSHLLKPASVVVSSGPEKK